MGMLGNLSTACGSKMRTPMPRMSDAVVYAPGLAGGGMRLDSAARFSSLAQDAIRSFSYPFVD